MRKLVFKLINMVGSILRFLGIQAGNLNSDVIVNKAMKMSGIRGVIDNSFREALEVITQSANKQPSFTLTGRLAFQDFVINRVSNRLQIDATLAEHPDILQQPVERPIFIAALPRTGTTLLQRLFSQDEALRIPEFWETERPCPPPEKESYDTDPRIQLSKKNLDIIDSISPQIKSIHELGARLPEECVFLFANDLISDFFVIGFDLPIYREWLNEQNLDAQCLLPLYESHKQQLQLLQYRYKKERWLLKAPSHLRALKSLMQVYPDAYIIQTHRDPTEIIASLASLLMAFWSTFHDKISPEKVGPIALELIGFWLDRGMEGREVAELDPNSQVHFIDVNYKDLVSNPIDTLRSVYEQCGLKWSPSLEQLMNSYLEENRQHKHGKHRYSLEQFGLNEEQVHARFAAYNKRFLGKTRSIESMNNAA